MGEELVWRLKKGPVVKEMVPEGGGHGIQSPKNGGDASRIVAVQRVKARESLGGCPGDKVRVPKIGENWGGSSHRGAGAAQGMRDYCGKSPWQGEQRSGRAGRRMILPRQAGRRALGRLAGWELRPVPASGHLDWGHG